LQATHTPGYRWSVFYNNDHFSSGYHSSKGPSANLTKIPVVICIDVEPDDRRIDPDERKPWLGFEVAHKFFNELRLRLKAATGSPVHFTWFYRMDPQIARTYGSPAWVANFYSPLIQQLKREGDAFGLHTHPWRWDETSNEWVSDMADQEWVDQCIRMAFRTFRESFGEPCLYSRFGDRWMNNATFALVEKLGARFELTLEPGLSGGPFDKPYFGSLADYRQVPRFPFRPSRKDFRVHGSFLKRRLWAIPLSAGSTNWLPETSSSAETGTESGDAECQEAHDSGVSDQNLEGYLDVVDSQYIAGWAYDRSKPDATLDLEIFDGEKWLATARAGTFRSDLLEAGKGDGKHYFNIPVPSWMKDGTSHLIRAKVAGTGFYLSNSPKVLICDKDDGSDEDIALNLSLDTWLQCRIIDTILSSEGNRYLAMVVRSEAGADPIQFSNMEQTCDHLLRHPLIGQIAFVTPDQVIKRML